MANETLIIGNSNWGGKASSLLGYFIDTASKYYARFITFGRNSIGTYINSSGVVATASANIPRVSANAFMIEPQRTNLVIYSEQIDNPAWLKLGSGGVPTVTADAATSPSGTNTADKVIAPAVSGRFYVANYFNPSISNGQDYVFSIYAKAAGLNYVFIRTHNNTNDLGGSGFIVDLTTGLITNPSSPLSSPSIGTVTSVGDGWWRITSTSIATATTTTSGGSGVWVTDSTNFLDTSGTAPANFTGNGVDGVFLWGAQFESFTPYASSYIPTTNASVTRLADSILRSNLYSEKMITSKGGTLLIELANNNANAYSISFSSQLLGLGNNTSGSGADNIWLGYGNNAKISIFKQVQGSSDTLYSSLYDNTKLAVRWNGATMDIFESGLQYVSESGFSPVQLQSLRTSSVEAPLYIKQLSLYDSPLDNATCAAKTAFDANVVSFLNTTGISDTTIINAVNNLVLNYKGKGSVNSTTDLWSKTYAIYPFTGGSTAVGYNLKNSSVYNLTFNGDWNLEDPEGITGNGTNTYADTGFNPSTELTLSSGRIGLYVLNNVNENAYDMGNMETAGVNQSIAIISRLNSSNAFFTSYGDINFGSSATNSESKGFYVTNRNSGTTTTGYKNGQLFATATQTSYTPNFNLYIGALNNNGTAGLFSSKTFSFGLIGQGLTDSESLLEYRIVQQFQKDLGRI